MDGARRTEPGARKINAESGNQKAKRSAESDIRTRWPARGEAESGERAGGGMRFAHNDGEHRTEHGKTTSLIAMITTFSDSALTPHSFGFAEVKTALVEPVLVVGAALFWLAALPFVALSLMCVKIWDTLMALKSGAGVRPNPLILRPGLAKSGPTVRSSPRTAQI